MKGWQAQASACDHGFVFHLAFPLEPLPVGKGKMSGGWGSRPGLQSSDHFFAAGQGTLGDPVSAEMGTEEFEWRGWQVPGRKSSLSSQERDPSQPTDQISFDFDQLGSGFDVFCCVWSG